MATVQAYTKSGVDAKFNSRSNMTLVHAGGGTPDIAAFPDAKTGDIIERSGDGARWSVLARNLNPVEGRVASVAGKSGIVTLTPSDVGAAPASHTHTKAHITDLNASATATANSMAQRDSGGRLVVGTPTTTTHATTKAYVDSAITGAKAWGNLTGVPSTFTPSAHTHTVANITDLTLATAATANTTPLRDSAGRFDVANPSTATQVANKGYVDSAVSTGTTWDNTSGKPSTFPPSTHNHTKAQITDLNASTAAGANTIAQRDSAGRLTVVAPTLDTQAATKKYVDDTVTAGATWGSLSGKPSTFPPATHTHTKAQITDLNESTAAGANTIAQRDSSGRLTVAAPTLDTHAATKKYVDDKVTTGVTWSSLSGKPSTFAPSAHTHSYNDITDSPRFDMGYGVVAADTVPTEFPAGVSYALSNAGSLGWNEALLADVPNALLPSFWMILTARQYSYDGSTIQQIYSYNRAGIPIYTRTWDHELEKWGPFRAITDDGHKHSTSDISDSTDVLHASHPSKLLKTRADGQLYIYTDTITSNTHAANKEYVDQRVATRAASSHTHTSANITDAVTYASGSTSVGDRILKTDASGRLTASNPTATQHVANKSYVDSEISAKTTWANTSGKPATFPPSSHTHTKDQITDLNASTTATASSIAQRDSSGRLTVATPSSAGHATTKTYVDNAIVDAKKWASLTGVPSTFAPSAHTHTVGQITDLNDSTVNDPSSIVRRTTTGHINALYPTLPGHAANRTYVDAKMPWYGTQTQYDAITTKDPDRLYIIAYF